MSKDLLLEIGTEEIPAHVMPHLLSDLKRLAGEQLRDQRLSYENLRTIGTPRRAALIVTGLAERQEDVSTETRGPSVAIAFDAAGNLTKAGEGFARGQGIDPSALIQRDGYVYASVHEKGAAAHGTAAGTYPLHTSPEQYALGRSGFPFHPSDPLARRTLWDGDRALYAGERHEREYVARSSDACTGRLYHLVTCRL